MKSQIFMYLFVFAALLSVFQYVNSKHILDSYEVQINKSKERAEKYKDSLVILQHKIENLKQLQ